MVCRTKADPMKPAPPVTRIFIFSKSDLLVLRFPVVIEGGVVIRNAPLVLGVVETVGHVNQQRGFAADHFISMAHARRDENLPRTQRPDVEGIAAAETRRAQAQIDQHYL